MTGADWKRICCPVDFSEPARVAMQIAADLARRHGAELTLFHAYPLPGYTLPDGSVVPSTTMLQDLATQTANHLAAWKAEAEQAGAPRVSTAHAIGDPAAVIVDFVRDGAYDLVVVGTHGRSGFRHALVGSVAERVVRRAPCPVLTVHPETPRRAG